MLTDVQYRAQTIPALNEAWRVDSSAPSIAGYPFDKIANLLNHMTSKVHASIPGQIRLSEVEKWNPKINSGEPINGLR